jgi:hypothetical protein
MTRIWVGIIAVAASLLLATATIAAPAHGKRRVTRHWHGYGFLPGYRSPERIEWERARKYGQYYGNPFYWDDTARFYHGRWNGGGFGPCWTQTPIGAVWNCGR